MKNKDDIIHQFDAYCKMVLRCEKIDYYREKRYRMEHEVFLCDLKEVLLDKYFVTQDSYTLGDTFSVMGYEVTVCDECLVCWHSFVARAAFKIRFSSSSSN